MISEKTKEQVKRHLQNCSFNGNDWRKVLDHCKTLYGGGSMHRALKPKYKSTYEEFMDWLENGHASGDIVRYRDHICIAADEFGDKTLISAMMTGSTLTDTELMEVPRETVSPASDDDRKAITERMRKDGYKFSRPLARLVRSFRPQDGKRVTAIIGDREYNGVFKCFEGDDVHLSFYIDNGEITENYVGPAELKMITREGVEEIDRVLKSHGLFWNYRSGNIEKETKRVGEGETYWYITDRFTIVSGKDSRNLRHNTRYIRGNYFVNYREALDFLNMIIQKRKGCR